jgi:NAD(P)H-hydrate epimerase
MSKVPYLTTDQMIEVDRLMIEKYNIKLIQMMENAGRNLAALSRDRFLGGNPVDKNILVMAGTGGNGGGAMVAARRLSNWGANVEVFLSADSNNYKDVPAHQLAILKTMGVKISAVNDLSDKCESDLILDGVIGYSLSGDPYGPAARLIEWANSNPTPILALDTPSGIDTSSGQIYTPAITATATMTLALPKQGLRSAGIEKYTGELYLADISVPPELYSEPSLNIQVPPIFAESDIIRLR